MKTEEAANYYILSRTAHHPNQNISAILETEFDKMIRDFGETFTEVLRNMDKNVEKERKAILSAQ